MHPETKQLVRLALLWHLLYCSGLEPNLDISEVSLWISTWVLVGTNHSRESGFSTWCQGRGSCWHANQAPPRGFRAGLCRGGGKAARWLLRGWQGHSLADKLHRDPAGSVRHPSRVSMSMGFHPHWKGGEDHASLVFQWVTFSPILRAEY